MVETNKKMVETNKKMAETNKKMAETNKKMSWTISVICYFCFFAIYWLKTSSEAVK